MKEKPLVRRMITLQPSQDDWLRLRATEIADETSQRPNISAVLRVLIDREMDALSKTRKAK